MKAKNIYNIAREHLHGHNYRMVVELAGVHHENSAFLFNFIDLKKIIVDIVDTFHSKMLLPSLSSVLANFTDKYQMYEDITDAEGHKYIKVTLLDAKRTKFLFPVEDVIMLPLSNTSVENMCFYFADRIAEELSKVNIKYCIL